MEKTVESRRPASSPDPLDPFQRIDDHRLDLFVSHTLG